MEPVVIDIAGTAGQFIKWVAVQVLVILAVIAFGLSAPILYPVGALWLAWRLPDAAPFWALVYLVLGPFACAFWMIFISHLPEFVAAFKGIRRTHDRESHTRGSGRAMSYMFIGFLGSLLTEGIFTYAAHVLNVIPHHLVLYFAMAPFAVFAPCCFALLRYWIRWDEYATV
jgi:hypothetical protein